MAKTKTKGTAKTVSDTPVPQPITISSTNPKIMADNIKKLEKAIKGADDASEISYDNTTSHLVASNVQAAIDEVVSEIGSIAASDVSYDNTDSGLTAATVQAAVDEVTGMVKSLVSYATTTVSVTVGANTHAWGATVKPSDTDYTWHLVAITPGNQNLIAAGFNDDGTLMRNVSSAEVTSDCYQYWIGILKTS